MASVNDKKDNRKDDNDTQMPGTLGGRRRRLILAAFHECIIEQGYAKTTLRDVAKRAGMTASHLLYYFPGKDAILERFFENVSQTIIERLESFTSKPPHRQIELLAELFFAGKGITRSEIGFMLECFGVAVHDRKLRDHKKRLDHYCKNYLVNLFMQAPGGHGTPEDAAEIGYSLLIGLRTAAYFDRRLKLKRAQRLFYDELRNLAGFSA
ncbi:MAG: TetR/AcrR family transcriptional regulator [Kiritimatiellia bacterium]|jgi:AcrR family transcriptional regulator|nr:TetR/AcrR family transcriptional regulator [Pseudomonadales bacterium]MDP7024042.1 TetR/AcrR family transcriptional regulator [Kiritimatiellia bacterium]